MPNGLYLPTGSHRIADCLTLAAVSHVLTFVGGCFAAVNIGSRRPPASKVILGGCPVVMSFGTPKGSMKFMLTSRGDKEPERGQIIAITIVDGIIIATMFLWVVWKFL